MEYGFNEPPAVGHSYTRTSGQRYELIEVQPYVRRMDKGASFLLTWRSACLTCGTDFTVTAGMKTNGLNRRCAAHKSPMQVQAPARVSQPKREAPSVTARVSEAWKPGELYDVRLSLDGTSLVGKFGRATKNEAIHFKWRLGADNPLVVMGNDPIDVAKVQAHSGGFEAKWCELKGAAAEPDATDLLS